MTRFSSANVLRGCLAGCLLVILLLATGVSDAAEVRESAPLQLTLPPRIEAVVGLPIRVYYDDIILSPTPTKYRFAITCGIGKSEPRCWAVTPHAADVGQHAWRVSVQDADGRQITEAATQLHVVPADVGAGQSVRLLIVGDSLTHATVYANQIATLLSAPGNPRWKMLGTHKTRQALDGVVHEGYGGWTWQAFVERCAAEPVDAKGRRRSSPFVFRDPDGAPKLDVQRYLDANCGGNPPDFITILLGINDCFSVNADDTKAVEARIDAMFLYADRLVDAFRKAAPNADIGICLTTAPNCREAAFEANYHGRYHQWGWKRIQHRLVQREIQYVGNREDPHVLLIPTASCVDPVDGYPENNGVHPNKDGYQQIGTTIYAWLKARLAQRAASDVRP